jgi:hypothetical protein
MKKASIILGLALLACVVSCGPSISVNHDYDPAYNFATLKTYDWIPVQGSAEVSDLKIKRFQSAINKELEAKGMKQSSENPDFLIALQGMAQTKVNVTDYGYSYGPYWGAGPRNIDVSTYHEGTIFLDFVDSNTKELFWRGTGSSVVEPGLSAEKQEEKFAMAASKLLAKFPPAGK